MGSNNRNKILNFSFLKCIISKKNSKISKTQPIHIFDGFTIGNKICSYVFIYLFIFNSLSLWFAIRIEIYWNSLESGI